MVPVAYDLQIDDRVARVEIPANALRTDRVQLSHPRGFARSIGNLSQD